MSSDEAMILARSLEKQYASWTVTMFSLHPVMDMNKYGEDFGAFIKAFHNNDNIPTNFRAAANALESTTGTDEEEIVSYVIESATAIVSDSNNGVGSACWDIVEEQLDTESLNDLYKPYERTAKILEDRMSSMKNANEAFTDNLQKTASRMRSSDMKDQFGGLNPGRTIPGTTTSYDHSQSGTDNNGNKYTDTDKGNTRVESTKIEGTKSDNWKNAIVADTKLSALEPTLINIQVVAHGSNKNGPNQFTHNLTLGVKTMVRLVRSDLLISNIADACKNSNAIFKFIKWAKGEVHTVRDVLLGVSKSKSKATNDKYENRMLQASIKRKKINNFSKFLDNKVMPNLTVILTSYEVMQVKDLTGVDLTQLHNVVSLMNKYYFLSFGIYDTTAQTLQIYFDGDEDFSWTSINAMKTQTNKSVDLKDTKEILRLMGRV